MPAVCADRPWGNVWGNKLRLLQIHLRLALAHNLADFRNANDDRTAAFEAKDAAFPLVTRLRSFALLVMYAGKEKGAGLGEA